MKGYEEIGSSWWKYCDVFPLLITQGSSFFNMTSIQLIKLTETQEKNGIMS